jgi:excisionase family DNA binding protein
MPSLGETPSSNLMRGVTMTKKDKPEPPEKEPKNRTATPAHARDPLMTVKETAVYLRVSKSFLDKARLTGEGPVFIRVGRKILYRRSVIDAWLMQRQFASTSQYEVK